MKPNSSEKIIIIFCGLIIALVLISSVQIYPFSKFLPNGEIYTQRVAYIDLKNALHTTNFKICDSTYIVDYYNYSQGDSVHRRTEYFSKKNGLRKEVMSKYVNREYNDSGYLNFRFIVNCKGEAGAYIIHENDLNLKPQEFNPDLVNQLLNITIGLKKWHPNFMRGKERDSYMYLSYRIENGNITEIIP